MVFTGSHLSPSLYWKTPGVSIHPAENSKIFYFSLAFLRDFWYDSIRRPARGSDFLTFLRIGGAASGKVRYLRQGRDFRYQGLPFPQTFQQNVEAQCQARQGGRRRYSAPCVRLYPVPPLQQGAARRLIQPNKQEPGLSVKARDFYHCFAENSFAFFCIIC